MTGEFDTTEEIAKQHLQELYSATVILEYALSPMYGIREHMQPLEELTPARKDAFEVFVGDKRIPQNVRHALSSYLAGKIPSDQVLEVVDATIQTYHNVLKGLGFDYVFKRGSREIETLKIREGNSVHHS